MAQGSKVVNALKVLLEEGMEDLLKAGVLEPMWVVLKKPKRASADGVAAAVMACASLLVVRGEEGFIRVRLVQVDDGSSWGESLCLEAQHKVAEIFARGCGNAQEHRGSGGLVKLKTAMERRSPVKVQAPSGHRTEERVVSRANDPTSREWPGDSADSGHRHSSEMPTISRSADFRNLGLAIHDETLDYDDDQEMEEGEIREDGKQTVDTGRQHKGCKNVNKERSFGVLQGSTS
ncbi:hypothetical protein NDU88_006283 [Pleurodeles waltl]|uniref:Uncharacterized protein n=1 Tax=Pleurodeles waltl TaxID=8319 RepID=A0AAV7NPT7_PLEWA|nr:hypothetical protein NDU88_006283 [Pleurodeles waltl]